MLSVHKDCPEGPAELRTCLILEPTPLLVWMEGSLDWSQPAQEASQTASEWLSGGRGSRWFFARG